MDVESERVGLWIDFICLGRIIQLLQRVPWPDAPTFGPNGDVCRRVVVRLEEVAGVEVGGEIGRDELFVLSARLQRQPPSASPHGPARKGKYHNSAFAPATIPVPGYVSHPIALPPNPRSNTDLGVQLHAHLEIAFEDGLGDRKSAGRGGIALEANHGVVVALLGFVGGSGDGGGAVDGFVEDGIVRVVLFHGTEVVGALEQVLSLAGGVFGADGLAVDALRREALERIGSKE